MEMCQGLTRPPRPLLTPPFLRIHASACFVQRSRNYPINTAASPSCEGTSRDRDGMTPSSSWRNGTRSRAPSCDTSPPRMKTGRRRKQRPGEFMTPATAEPGRKPSRDPRSTGTLPPADWRVKRNPATPGCPDGPPGQTRPHGPHPLRMPFLLRPFDSLTGGAILTSVGL